MSSKQCSNKQGIVILDKIYSVVKTFTKVRGWDSFNQGLNKGCHLTTFKFHQRLTSIKQRLADTDDLIINQSNEWLKAVKQIFQCVELIL